MVTSSIIVSFCVEELICLRSALGFVNPSPSTSRSTPIASPSILSSDLDRSGVDFHLARNCDSSVEKQKER